MAEASLKVDVGIQGRVEGVYGGILKAKADINVVKAELFNAKADLRAPFKADSYDIDYAGKDGKTKVSNGLTLQGDIPILPKTPWGNLAIGVMYEQSQWIDANLNTNGFNRDYDLYAIVPVIQPTKMKKISKELKENPSTHMAKGPSISTKGGKQKDFYGLDVGLGAAMILGVSGKVKVGLK